MRVSTSDFLARWTGVLGLFALVALAWSALAPGVFWTAVLVAGLLGAAAATALLVHGRRVPSLAQVISTAEAEPAVGEAARKA